MARLGATSINGDASVSGNVKARGYVYGEKTYNPLYADYAEMYEQSSNYKDPEAGDVVCLDDSIPVEGYTKSDRKNRRFPVGVLSHEFGMLVGGKPITKKSDTPLSVNEGYNVPIGKAGRVHVKTIGHISKGDLLIPDELGEGRARRANLFERIFRREMIIGRAITDTTGKFSMRRPIETRLFFREANLFELIFKRDDIKKNIDYLENKMHKVRMEIF